MRVDTSPPPDCLRNDVTSKGNFKLQFCVMGRTQLSNGRDLGREIVIKGWQRSGCRCRFIALSVLYASSCIVPLPNMGSDPSESIRVIGVVVVIDLKTTDPLECARVTLDGSGYSTDRGSRVSSRGLWRPIRTIMNKNCPNKKKDILEFREK